MIFTCFLMSLLIYFKHFFSLWGGFLYLKFLSFYCEKFPQENLPYTEKVTASMQINFVSIIIIIKSIIGIISLQPQQDNFFCTLYKHWLWLYICLGISQELTSLYRQYKCRQNHCQKLASWPIGSFKKLYNLTPQGGKQASNHPQTPPLYKDYQLYSISWGWLVFTLLNILVFKI